MRALSMANATLGVLCSASLAVHAIGQGLAHARGLITKHAVKQVDRLLSNRAIDVWSSFAYWVPFVIGPRTEIRVALDWREFDAGDQSTIALNMITRHGRATPLLRKTVRKSSLKGRRNDLLVRFKEVLPEGAKVTLVAITGDRIISCSACWTTAKHTAIVRHTSSPEELYRAFRNTCL
jgi:hypothetical protein